MKIPTTATTGIILEERTPRKDGKSPVKLRITFQRERHYYSLKNTTGENIALIKNDFKKIYGEKPRGKFKEFAIYLNKIEDMAREVIRELPIFSFDAFEKRFFSGHGSKQDLLFLLKNKAQQLKDEGRITTAITFTRAASSLKAFKGLEILPITKIDVNFLNEYERWMYGLGKSPTTTGIHLRNVRVIFNAAIINGTIRQEVYPFGKGKYQIPTGRNIKKALPNNEIGLIASYPAIDGTSEQRYRDYWLFLYLCNGMNLKDMSRLKYNNIDIDTIIFTRAKTQRENKQNPRNVTVIITPSVGRIIDRWGNKPGTPEQFIFPILDDGITPLQEYHKIQQATKMVNKYIRKIAKIVGISNDVSTSTARHSNATVLLRAGASHGFISENHGHSSVVTTENYLAGYSLDEKRKWAEKVEQSTKLTQ